MCSPLRSRPQGRGRGLLGPAHGRRPDAGRASPRIARAPCGGGTWVSPHGWLGPRMRKCGGGGRSEEEENHRDEQAVAAGAPPGSLGSVGSGSFGCDGAAAAKAGLAGRARAAEQASG